MSKAYQCDRCGAFYAPIQHDNEYAKKGLTLPLKSHIPYLATFNLETHLRNEWDLCPDCMLKLKKFMISED